MHLSGLKQSFVKSADFLGVARLFRYINRKKLLVVMYHGVTNNDYDPPIWTQLPVAIFRQQLQFLAEQYHPVSLTDVIAAIKGESTLPDRAVLITFDDGLKNNYSVAFPHLLALKLPAAIFLTVDLIGSEEVFWFDELFFLLKEAAAQRISPSIPDLPALALLQKGQVWECYRILVESMKRSGLEKREQQMTSLRAEVQLDRVSLLADFGLLDWEDVSRMDQSGLIEFGVHTATHRILTELLDDEWEREIVIPKQTLENQLGKEIAAFCFPNGKPHDDFRTDQFKHLRKAGYSCAFTTENSLFEWTFGNGMSIGRVPAGNDATSEPQYFSCNASGALHSIMAMTRGSLNSNSAAKGNL